MKKYTVALFKLTAEHLRNTRQVIQSLSREYVVELAGAHQVFSGMYIIVIRGSRADALAVQKHLWENNGGASVELEEITADDLEAMQ